MISLGNRLLLFNFLMHIAMGSTNSHTKFFLRRNYYYREGHLENLLFQEGVYYFQCIAFMEVWELSTSFMICQMGIFLPNILPGCPGEQFHYSVFARTHPSNHCWNSLCFCCCLVSATLVGNQLPQSTGIHHHYQIY